MPAPNTARLRQLVPYVLAGGTGIFLFYTATQIEFQRRADVLGPDYWPKLILGMLITVCLYEIVRIALAKNPELIDLEVIKMWNGQTPRVVSGGSGGASMLLPMDKSQLPSPPTR